MTDSQDTAQVARLGYALYVETLRARLSQEQFDLLMQIIRRWAAAGGGIVCLELAGREKELFTPELQQEFLHLMGLIGAVQPGHEDGAAHVAAQVEDGEHSWGAMALVPPEIAADSAKRRALREDLDSKARRRRTDRETVEGIARASGMSSADPGDS